MRSISLGTENLMTNLESLFESHCWMFANLHCSKTGIRGLYINAMVTVKQNPKLKTALVASFPIP